LEDVWENVWENKRLYQIRFVEAIRLLASTMKM